MSVEFTPDNGQSDVSFTPDTNGVSFEPDNGPSVLGDIAGQVKQMVHGVYLANEEAGVQAAKEGHPLGGPDTQSDLEQQAATTRKQLQADQKQVQVNEPTSRLGRDAVGAAVSVGQMAPVMIGALSGNPGAVLPGLETAYNSEYGQTYAQERTPDAQGHTQVADPDVARNNAELHGYTEAGFEASPATVVGKALIHGTGVKQFAKELIKKELPSEALTTAGQDTLDWAQVNSDQSTGAFLKDLGNDELDTLIQTPMVGVGGAVVGHGVHAGAHALANGVTFQADTEAKPYTQGDVEFSPDLTGQIPNGETGPNIPTLTKDQLQVASNPPKSVYDNTFREVANREGVPYDVLRAVGYRESRWRQDIISGKTKSDAGAIGLMQILPDTALKINNGKPVDLANPTQSIITAAKILKQNYEHFGNWHDAVAAYNGGWDPHKWGNSQTQGYLKEVFGTGHFGQPGQVPVIPEVTQEPDQGVTLTPDGTETDTETAAPPVTPAPNESIASILDRIEKEGAPTAEEIAWADQIKQQLLAGDEDTSARHVPEAAGDLLGINQGLQEQTQPDEVDPDVGKSGGEIARRLTEEDPNAIIPRQNRVVSVGPDAAQGLLLHEAIDQGHLQPGTVLGIGKPSALFTPDVQNMYYQAAQQWLAKFMPQGRLILNFEKLPDGAMGAHFMTPTGIHVITPRDLLSAANPENFNLTKASDQHSAKAQAAAVYSFSHEFGHALAMHELMRVLSPEQFSMVHDTPGDQTLSPEQIQSLPVEVQPLVQEYNDVKARVLGGQMTAADFVKHWVGTWKAGIGVQTQKDENKNLTHILTKYGVAPGASALELIRKMYGSVQDPHGTRYGLSFPEYMAEQFSRYAYAKKLPENSAFGKSGLVAAALQRLRDFFKFLKADGIIKPGVKFQEWVDGLSRRQQGSAGAQRGAKLSPANTASAKAEAPIEQRGTAGPNPSPELTAAKNPEVDKAFRRAIISSRVKEDRPETYAKWMNMVKFGQYEELNHALEEYTSDFVRVNYDKDTERELKELGIGDMRFAGLSEEEAKKPTIRAKAEKLWKELGERSPFFKRWFGDWETYVQGAYAGWAAQMRRVENQIAAVDQAINDARMGRVQWRPGEDINTLINKLSDLKSRQTRLQQQRPRPPVEGIVSKVVDAIGHPLRVYHGTGFDFDTFNMKMGGTTAGGPDTRGVMMFASQPDTATHYANYYSNNPERGDPAAMAELQDVGQEAHMVQSMLLDHLSNVPEADFTSPEETNRRFLEFNLKKEQLKAHLDELTEKMQELRQKRITTAPMIYPVYLNMRNPYVLDMGQYDNRYDGVIYSRAIAEARAAGRDGVIVKNVHDGGPLGNVYIIFSPEQVKSAVGNATFSDGSAIHWDRTNPEENSQAMLFEGVGKLGLGKRLNRLWAKGARWTLRAQTYMLQLQQWAHLHPEIEGLQFLDQLRLRYTQFKNLLQETPARVAKLWTRLPKEARAKMEKFLQQEYDSGKHLTDLAMENGKWVHKASSAMEQRLTDLGVDTKSELGQKIAQQILDIKNSLLEHQYHLGEVIFERLTQRYANNPTVLKVEQYKVMQALKEIREKPFLPQQRFGQYVLFGYKKMQAADGKMRWQKVHQEHFETPEDRAPIYEKLKPTESADTRWSVKDLSDYQATIMTIPHTFLDNATEVLDLTPEDRAALAELLEPVKVDRGFKPYDGKMLKLTGASKDLLRNYTSFTWHNANMLAKMRYRPQMNRMIAMVRSEKNSFERSGLIPAEILKQKQLYESTERMMRKVVDYMMSPENELQTLRGLVALTYLWGNIKTAALQADAAIGIVSDLTAKYGMVKGLAEFARAARDVVRVVWNRDALLPHEHTAMDTARKEGILDQSYAYHLAAIANAGNLSRMVKDSKVGPVGQRTLELGMEPFRWMDLYFRRVGLLADFRSRFEDDLRDVKKEGAQNPISAATTRAYSYAISKVMQLQNDFSQANRPEFMRGKKSVFMIFFSYMQQKMFVMMGGYELGDRRRESMETGETPSAKKWLYGTTARMWMIYLLIGGLQGLPFAENLLDVLNVLYRKMFKADIRQDMRHFVKELGWNANLVMHGLSHDVGGFDLSPSVGLGRVIPGTDVLTSEGSWNDRFSQGATEVAGPLGGAIKNVGKFLTSDDPLLQRMAKFGLGTMKNVSQAYDWAENGARYPSGALIARDENGKPRDLATGEIMGKALGMTPEAVSQAQEEHYAVKDMEQFWMESRKTLLNQMWAARLSKDREAIADTRKAIQEYNANAPDRGLRITGKDLANSFHSHRRAMQHDSRDQAQQKHFRGLDQSIRGNY